MGVKVALMVRSGQRVGPLPAGRIFLIAELADGLTRRDLDTALAARTFEITDFEAMVGLEPEVPPVAEPAPAVTEKPRPAHVAPSAPAVTEKPPPAPIAPSAPATTEKPSPGPIVTSPGNASALKAAVAQDEAAKALAEKHSRAELVKKAQKAGATFSDRGTKEDIAREIIEAEAAKKAKRGR